MKTKQYIGMMMMAAALASATSCSDFDDYNTAPEDLTPSANQTLWENISGNSNLSDFAALVKKAGFADELNAAHYYTVWAPVNGSFDASAYANTDSTQLLREFVKNHIAEYNHSAVGEISERVHTLNEKAYNFEGAGSYTFDDVSLSQTNLPSTNGLMHLLNGQAAFYPNIYEYLDKVQGADSVVSFFKHYETTYLDGSRSVVGPVVNGKQTYIDSVMVTYNSLTTTNMHAYIDREDSVYTMFFPTNDAWNELYARIKPYYNYRATTSAQDLSNATSATVAPTTTQTINNAYYTDSIAKRYMVRNLIFNNNNRYNQWVEDQTAERTDTIRTVGNYLSNPEEVLARTIDKERMSNGYARLVDSLALQSWDTYSPMIKFNARTVTGAVWSGTSSRPTVTIYHSENDGKMETDTTFTYLHVTPTSNYARPQLDLYLPDARSTTYNIYLEIIPAYDDNDALVAQKPNQLDFTLNYCNANGALTSVKLNQKVENNPSRVDTVYVGKITFPICYYGLDVYPNLKITSDFSVFNAAAMAKYTRDIRVGQVILKPVELEEYEANK